MFVRELQCYLYCLKGEGFCFCKLYLGVCYSGNVLKLVLEEIKYCNIWFED